MASLMNMIGQKLSERKERKEAEKVIQQEAFDEAFKPARTRHLQEQAKAKAERKAQSKGLVLDTVDVFGRGAKRSAPIFAKGFVQLVKSVGQEATRPVGQKKKVKGKGKVKGKVAPPQDLFFGGGNQDFGF